MTQSQRVFSYLQEHKLATGNELRSTLHIVDIPKAISLLKRSGVTISDKRNRDGTKTYYLGEKPRLNLGSVILTKDGRAIL